MYQAETTLNKERLSAAYSLMRKTVIDSMTPDAARVIKRRLNIIPRESAYQEELPEGEMCQLKTKRWGRIAQMTRWRKESSGRRNSMGNLLSGESPVHSNSLVLYRANILPLSLDSQFGGDQMS